LLVVHDALRHLLTRGATGAELKAAARAAGMRTLLDEGKRLVDLDQTTAIEVERVISGVEDA
jgi:type II secretory ATPase GspE/PulE/Tfp pilus assembly ATPase PilB-like protein